MSVWVSNTPWHCVEGSQGVSAVGVFVSPASVQPCDSFVHTLHTACLCTQTCAPGCIISNKVFRAGPGPVSKIPHVCAVRMGVFWWAHIL